MQVFKQFHNCWKGLQGLALSDHISLGTLVETWGIHRLHIHDETMSRYRARLPVGLEDPSEGDLGLLQPLVYVSRCLSQVRLKIASTSIKLSTRLYRIALALQLTCLCFCVMYPGNRGKLHCHIPVCIAGVACK